MPELTSTTTRTVTTEYDEAGRSVKQVEVTVVVQSDVTAKDEKESNANG